MNSTANNVYYNVSKSKSIVAVRPQSQAREALNCLEFREGDDKVADRRHLEAAEGAHDRLARSAQLNIKVSQTANCKLLLVPIHGQRH